MSNWQDVVDPEGRLAKGMRVRFRHSSQPIAEVLGLCAPMGLYRRPVVPGEEWEDMAVQGRLACDADHPNAEYVPELLRVRIRYLGGDETTLRACDLEEI